MKKLTDEERYNFLLEKSICKGEPLTDAEISELEKLTTIF